MPGGERSARFLFDEGDAGALRHSEHHRPGPLAVVVLLLAPVLVPVVFYDDVTSVGIALVYYGVALAFLVLLYLSGWMNRTKVYDRAVVLDTSWPGGQPYVIPLETIDPERVRYHRRANLIGRRLGQGKRTLRTGPYTGRAISFDGLSPHLAHPRHRNGLAARRGARDPGSRAMSIDDPTGIEDSLVLDRQTWVVATGTPKRLLNAVEAALVDAGHTDAAGLSVRLFADPVVERWRRPLTEDEIYRRR